MTIEDINELEEALKTNDLTIVKVKYNLSGCECKWRSILQNILTHGKANITIKHHQV